MRSYRHRRSVGRRRAERDYALQGNAATSLQLRATQVKKALKVLDTRVAGGRRLDLCIAAGEQPVADQVALQRTVVALVAVAHEAVVTGGLAVFLHPRGAVAVLARVGIEVAEGEGLSDDGGKGTRLFDETAQHAGAAFGGFIEQQGSAVVNGRQGCRVPR
jgi:hypothetical protein